MATIYKTNKWSGYGKQNYYSNEYRTEGDNVVKYKCNDFKVFDGKENNWEHTERKIQSWNINDESMPSWLEKHIKR